MNRPYTLHQLAKIGPPAADAIPTLNTVLTSDRPLERYLAVCALEAIGPQSLPSIKQALNDADPIVREAAAEAIRAIRTAGGARS
jgi:HEAT repeat protein